MISKKICLIFLAIDSLSSEMRAMVAYIIKWTGKMFRKI